MYDEPFENSTYDEWGFDWRLAKKVRTATGTIFFIKLDQ